MLHNVAFNFYFSTKVDRLWKLSAKILHHSKKGYKKVHNQVSRRGVTQEMRKLLHMASHVNEMKEVHKLKRMIKGNRVVERISEKE